jgi:hypothetical protein
VIDVSGMRLAAKRELARRTLAAGEKDQQQALYLAGLSKPQREVIDSKAKVKTVRTGRRGGKTHLLARLLFKKAQDRSGAICLFIALTRPSAKRLIWGELHRVNRKFGLGATFNNQDLTVTLPNGSQIWLAGATRGAEIEKLRGHPFDLICCDESGSFGEEFEYLLKEVLNAALEDYDGELVLVGTPNAAAAGAFFDYDTSTAEHIEHFHWTVLDNPNFPRWAGKKNWAQLAKKWWADKVKREGWAEDDPVMHREWLAKWVRDANRLVYRVSPDNLLPNFSTKLGQQEYDYILGCDLGWNDAKTIVVLACSRDTNKLIYVDMFEQSGMLIDDYADTLKAFVRRYDPVAIVCDAGAIGKDVVELLRQRHALPITAAEKTQKPSNIQFLNSALKSQKVMFSAEARAVHRQMSLLQWKDKLQTKTDQAFREDLCDAALYAFRYATNVWKPERLPDVTKPGSREWFDEQAAKRKAAQLRRVARSKNDADDIEAEILALIGRG